LLAAHKPLRITKHQSRIFEGRHFSRWARVYPAGFSECGITEHQPGEYEVDHLIPLWIGGSNSIKNLWPESYRTLWNARVKDRLEDRLHALAISGRLDLKTAQREIATDWIAAYKKYIGPSPGSAIVLIPPEPARTDWHHPIRVAKPRRPQLLGKQELGKIFSAWPAMVR
jgi:hypothetical protein